MTMLAIQEKHRLWIGADSFGLMKEDGKLIRRYEEQQKLFPVGHDVIYCDGNHLLVDKLIETFITKTDRTITELQLLATLFLKEYIKNYPDEYGPEGNCALHEIVVATSEDQGTVLYTLSPERNFEIIVHVVGEGDSLVYTSGYNHDDASVSAEIKRLKNEDMFRVFEDTFGEIACEKVGGCLEAYRIDSGSIPECFLEIDITPKEGGYRHANRF